jgi:hypothetical protein
MEPPHHKSAPRLLHDDPRLLVAKIVDVTHRKGVALGPLQPANELEGVGEELTNPSHKLQAAF